MVLCIPSIMLCIDFIIVSIGSSSLSICGMIASSLSIWGIRSPMASLSVDAIQGVEHRPQRPAHRDPKIPCIRYTTNPPIATATNTSSGSQNRRAVLNMQSLSVVGSASNHIASDGQDRGRPGPSPWRRGPDHTANANSGSDRRPRSHSRLQVTALTAQSRRHLQG